MLVRRSSRPTRVMRGSAVSLNIGSSSLSNGTRSASCASAFRTIVRNLSIDERHSALPGPLLAEEDGPAAVEQNGDGCEHEDGKRQEQERSAESTTSKTRLSAIVDREISHVL